MTLYRFFSHIFLRLFWQGYQVWSTTHQFSEAQIKQLNQGKFSIHFFLISLSLSLRDSIFYRDRNSKYFLHKVEHLVPNSGIIFSLIFRFLFLYSRDFYSINSDPACPQSFSVCDSNQGHCLSIVLSAQMKNHIF